MPSPVKNPKLILFNSKLARDLELPFEDSFFPEYTEILSGNKIATGSEPIAQAYAGHQFGHFTKLGDGRAILLGEHITSKNNRFDIQLKGAGQTPYSRRGDGRATQSSMLREYLMSEAMFHLSISTTRSLAVVSSGEDVYRSKKYMGAVLTRVAESHIRVGTFEYIRQFHSKETLLQFTQYVIHRHFPELESEENSALGVLEKVMLLQIDLIIQWMRVGFIHGVMNTDNMSISGETIDYGPCAFMNAYDPKTVFSSIDEQGRYCFGNQANIAHWNLMQLAESLLPIIDDDIHHAIKKAQAVLDTYSAIFEKKHLEMMGLKIGIQNIQTDDHLLIKRLLDWLLLHQADYTNTFIQLSDSSFSSDSIYHQADFIQWISDWKNRIQLEQNSVEIMQKNNPNFIPRNHIVENALEESEQDSLDSFTKLLHVLSTPYDYTKKDAFYQNSSTKQEDRLYKTYCGT